MSTLCIDRSSMQYIPFADNSKGSSEASEKLSEILRHTITDLRKASTWNIHHQAIDDLVDTYDECSNENWDGYNAVPISANTYNDALRFINALSSSLPSPEIVPEPTGEVGFEWNFGKDLVFVASVDGTNRITYAGLLGKGNKTHGIEVFNGSIPQTIVDKIKRIYK